MKYVLDCFKLSMKLEGVVCVSVSYLYTTSWLYHESMLLFILFHFKCSSDHYFKKNIYLFIYFDLYLVIKCLKKFIFLRDMSLRQHSHFCYCFVLSQKTHNFENYDSSFCLPIEIAPIVQWLIVPRPTDVPPRAQRTGKSSSWFPATFTSPELC